MGLLSQTENHDPPPEREPEWENVPLMPDLGEAEALLLELASVFAPSSSEPAVDRWSSTPSVLPSSAASTDPNDNNNEQATPMPSPSHFYLPPPSANTPFQWITRPRCSATP